MAITFVAAGTVALNNANATTLNVPYPAGIQAGDVIAMAIGVNSTTLPTIPTGWLAGGVSSTSGGSAPCERIILRVCDGTETGSVAVTTASATSRGQMLAFRGVDNATPLDNPGSVTASATATTSYVLPSQTTTRAGCALVLIGVANTVAGTWTSPSIGGETFTETAETSVAIPSTGIQYLIWSGSGATGTVTYTRSTNVRGCTGMLALRPSADLPYTSPEPIATSRQTGVAGPSAAIDLPAAPDGSLDVVVALGRGGTPYDTPSGWTLDTSGFGTNGGGSGSVQVWSKVRAGGQTSQTFTLTSGGATTAIDWVVLTFSADGPVSTAGASSAMFTINSGTRTAASPSVDAAGPGVLLHAVNVVTNSTDTPTPPAGMDTVYVAASGTATVHYLVGLEPLSAGGATGTRTATYTGTNTGTGIASTVAYTIATPITGTGSLTASAATASASGVVLGLPTVRTNRVLDPDTTAPTDSSRWFVLFGSASASGGKLRATATGSSGFAILPTLGGTGALGGANYTATPGEPVYVMATPTNPTTKPMYARWYLTYATGGGAEVSVAQGTAQLVNGEQVTLSSVVPGTAAQVNIRLQFAANTAFSTGAPGDMVDVTDFLFQRGTGVGSTDNTEYFSGASTDTANVDYAWTGTANNSTSTRTEYDSSSLTGTGALAATAATLSGSGTVVTPAVTGTAALAAAAAVLAGSAALGITGTGAASATAATLSGSAAVKVTGTGAASATAATVAGSGVVRAAGSGAVSATPATLSGSGTIVVPPSFGTGALTAPAATLSGSGVIIPVVTGVGDLEPAQALLSGSGTVSFGGSGAVQATPAALSGVGDVRTLGSGDLYATAPTLSGTATLTVLGSGALVPAPAELSAAGVITDTELPGTTPATRTYTVQAEVRTYTVRAESRTVTATSEHREITA